MKILLISSLLLVAVYGGPVYQNELNDIIEKVNSSGAKWKAGNNFGENITIASLKRLMGVRKDKVLTLLPRAKHSIPDSSIPESFDAREHWPQCKSIGHIADQGRCGSCWAVAAAGAFTDRLCIATNGKFTLPLSAEELMACCYDAWGCNGGYPEDAWKYFAKNGIVTGGDYNSNVGCQPYEIPACLHVSNGQLPSCGTYPEFDTPVCQRKCTNQGYSTPFSSDHHRIENAYSVSGGVNEIQKEIMAHGPVETTFTVYKDFVTYKSGVYHHVTGKKIGRHAVKIIGWGVEDGTPYWLIANQWNESWGEKGLFRILRGKNDCDVESEIVAGIPKV